MELKNLPFIRHFTANLAFSISLFTLSVMNFGMDNSAYNTMQAMDRQWQLCSPIQSHHVADQTYSLHPTLRDLQPQNPQIRHLYQEPELPQLPTATCLRRWRRFGRNDQPAIWATAGGFCDAHHLPGRSHHLVYRDQLCSGPHWTHVCSRLYWHGGNAGQCAHLRRHACYTPPSTNRQIGAYVPSRNRASCNSWHCGGELLFQPRLRILHHVVHHVQNIPMGHRRLLEGSYRCLVHHSILGPLACLAPARVTPVASTQG